MVMIPRRQPAIPNAMDNGESGGGSGRGVPGGADMSALALTSGQAVVPIQESGRSTT